MNPQKKEIYLLIDKIIKQEDELNNCLNTKDNQSIVLNIKKNKQRIDSLSSFI
jgi:flagellin-specific chaperone FliS